MAMLPEDVLLQIEASKRDQAAPSSKHYQAIHH